MKKLSFIFTIMLAVVFMFASCGGNGNNNEDGDNTETVSENTETNPLVGKWKAYKAEGVGESSNNDVEYTLNEDGTAKVSYVDEYTYEISGDTLKMIYNESIIIPWIYTLEGEELFLDNVSADQKIWFKKQ